MKEGYSSYRFSGDFHSVVYKKNIAYQLAEIILSFCTFYPLLVILIYVTTKNTSYILKGILFIIPIVALGFTVSKIKRLLLYMIVSNLAFIVAIIFSWPSLLSIEILLFLLSYNIYFIAKRKKNDDIFWQNNKLVLMNIILGLLYTISMFVGTALINRLIFILAIINVLICLVYFHWSSTEKLINWEKYENKKDIKNMKAINAMFALIMVAIIVAAIVISYSLGVFGSLDLLSRKVIDFFGRNHSANIEPLSNHTQNPVQDVGQMNNLDSMYSEGGPFLKAVGAVIKLFFSGVAIAAFIFLFISFIQFLYKKVLNRNKKVNEKREFIITKEEVAERVKTRFKSSINSLKGMVYKNNRDKIRAIYYKAIVRYKKKGIAVEQTETPKEIENNIKEAQSINLSEATLIYEKARYSEDEPSESLVEEIKRGFRK